MTLTNPQQEVKRKHSKSYFDLSTKEKIKMIDYAAKESNKAQQEVKGWEEEKWVKEFDEKWKPCYIGQIGIGGAEVTSYIKDFIHHLLEADHKAIREKLIDKSIDDPNYGTIVKLEDILNSLSTKTKER